MATPGRARLHEAEREITTAADRLLGAPPEDVALLANTSEALNLLANSPHWRPGEMLISDLEFPHNVAAWLMSLRRCHRHGVWFQLTRLETIRHEPEVRRNRRFS